VALFVGLLGGCATNPVTGRKEVSLVTTADELAIGKAGYGAVIEEYGLYDDPALQAYVNTIGQKVAHVSHLPNLEWHFTIVDDPAVNAFAMPGGYIYITRGILPYLNSEAQLAGVLGHEIGHVTHRLTAEQMTQQQLIGAGFALGSIVSPTFQRYSGAAQQAMGLLFLKFSRTDETQADELGVAYATKAGYDPRDIPATYVMLGRIGEQSGQSLPGFLSTHPDPGDRATVTTRLANQAVVGKSGLLINHDVYVHRMEAVIYGQDPRQGYFDGDHYFHPTLGFQMTFPAGWQHQDSHASVAAGEPNQLAVVQLSLAHPSGTPSPAEFVAQLAANGSIASSDGSAVTIGSYPAWVGHLTIAPQGQTPVTLDATFIRKGDQLFQILGQSKTAGDAYEGLIFSTMRSFSGLSDPARINVKPDHVRVRGVTANATLDVALGGFGARPADFETAAIMNNLHTTDRVTSGTLVKFVERVHPGGGGAGGAPLMR
jgi:predicted Zn-dependent protease